MSLWAIAKFALATAMLIWAVVEDLRTKKFRNRTFLIYCALGLGLLATHSLAVASPSPLLTGSMASLTALCFFLPLVLLKVLGSGDMKLMLSIGLLGEWNAVLEASVLALLWAAVFGLVQILTRGRVRDLIFNLKVLAISKSADGIDLNRIPFTVPLLLGWLTQWSIANAGQSLW